MARVNFSTQHAVHKRFCTRLLRYRGVIGPHTAGVTDRVAARGYHTGRQAGPTLARTSADSVGRGSSCGGVAPGVLGSNSPRRAAVAWLRGTPVRYVDHPDRRSYRGHPLLPLMYRAISIAYSTWTKGRGSYTWSRASCRAAELGELEEVAAAGRLGGVTLEISAIGTCAHPVRSTGGNTCGRGRQDLQAMRQCGIFSFGRTVRASLYPPGIEAPTPAAEEGDDSVSSAGRGAGVVTSATSCCLASATAPWSTRWVRLRSFFSTSMTFCCNLRCDTRCAPPCQDCSAIGVLLAAQ